MLLYRGALVYAEDRNHDERSGLTPPELEYLTHVVFGRPARGDHRPMPSPEDYLAVADRLPTAIHPTATVQPFVNHGQWMIRCPNRPVCSSASIASKHDHRFYCVECHANGAVSDHWLRVVWPESAEEIEALLVMRPDRRTRNWAPPETLGDLVVENEKHGVL